MTVKHHLRALSVAVLCVALLSGGALARSSDDALPSCDASHVRTSDRPYFHFLRVPQPGGFLSSPATEAYIQSIADPIRAAYGFPAGEPKIYVVPTFEFIAQSEEENAIFISYGVLLSARTSDVLAAYLAHEMGHLACHHARQNQLWDAVDWTLKAGLLASEFGGGSWVQGLGKNVQAVVYLSGVTGVAKAGAEEWVYTHAGWSRDQETEADLMAAEMLVRAHKRTNGLILALSALGSPQSADGGQHNKSSAFSGNNHPDAGQRINDVNNYLANKHTDYHDPMPDEQQRQVWLSATKSTVKGLNYLLKADQALAEPLALVGHSEYTSYRSRNEDALEFVRLAFNAPHWQPNSDLPAQTDSELAALANLTLTKIIVAELRIRLAPFSVEQPKFRKEILSGSDVPEHYLMLNALGYMISDRWMEAIEVTLAAHRIAGETRENDILGVAASSGGKYPSTLGIAQSGYTMSCMLTADQQFMAQCADVQKQPVKYITTWWTDARMLPPVPPVPTPRRKRWPVLPPNAGKTEKPPVSDEDLKKGWLNQ